MPDFTSTVNVPASQQTVTVSVPATVVTATVAVDTNNLKTVLRLVGWAEANLDMGQAIAQAESGAYSDAVGDITLIGEKYGPSIGLFQIRSLRSPQSFGGNDLYRYAWPLRNPFFNAAAALAITKGGTDFALWSTFTSGAYKPYLGQDPVIKTGHAQAANWWR